MYVHELQTTLKCSQQPKTVWGQESVVDSFCCYTILPQPSVPLLVLYLSSCLKKSVPSQTPWGLGVGEERLLRGQLRSFRQPDHLEPRTTGSGLCALPREGSKGIVEGSKRSRWKREMERVERRQRGKWDLMMLTIADKWGRWREIGRETSDKTFCWLPSLYDRSVCVYLCFFIWLITGWC